MINGLSPKEYIEFVINTKLYQKYKPLCRKFIESEEVLKAYGASLDNPQHHGYPGGLVEHTAEVLYNCLCMSDASTASGLVNVDALITGAIYHDIGKVYDYSSEGRKTDHYKLQHHVHKSYAIFLHACIEANITDKEFIDLVAHMILSHHGRKDWGSIIAPQTLEAVILHASDHLSACSDKVKNGAKILC